MLFIKEGVKTVSEHQHLGVWLTHNLEWGKHVKDIFLKANTKLYVLHLYGYLFKEVLIKVDLDCSLSRTGNYVI